MDDNIKKLHQALIDDGYDDVGTEQEFRDYVSDSKNVATLYNALSEAGYDNFKDQKSLETYLSAKAPVAQKPSTPQSSGQSVYSKEKKQTQYPQEVIDAFNSPDNKPGNFKDLAQLNDEYQRGELKKPGIISQALGMFSNVDAGNVGKEQKVGGMIANMLLGDNMQQPHDNNQQVQHLNQDNVPATEQTKPTAKDADAITSAAPVQQVDAIYNKYVGKGDALSETMYDLMASGQAKNQEEAQNMAMGAMNRAASRLAQRTTDEFVSKLGDTVEGVDEAVMNGWHSHAVQDNLKKLASQYGIMNNVAVDENGQYITQTNGYDQFINGMVKPAMVESLVKKYGENYRKTAEDLATRLYSNDEVIQNQLMNQDINAALVDVIGKYVNPSVVDEYNKAQEAGSKAFTEGMEGSQFIPANLRLGTALGAQYEANEAKDPAKVLSSLQKKFGRLYRNPEFLNDMSNAAFKVMQRYGLNGTQSSDPKQFKPMINSVLKNELDQLEIKGMMPKGSAEYIMKTGLGNTIVGKITRKAVQTDYQNWLEDIANQQYQPGFWENVASGALTFAGDAWSYWLPGAAGGKLTKSMVAKAEGKLAGDLMAKGMERRVAERAAKVLVGKSKAAALKSGAAHGAVTFGGQSAISKPIDEIYRTGQFDENGKIYNPSVGKVIANTLGEVAKQSAVGAIMQGGTIANMVGKGRGLATNILADIGGKVVDSGIMTGHQMLERMAQDPNFKPTGKDAAESFLESMANLTAIGLPGMMGKYARFKDAREFNKKFDFTDQDIAELKRFGYDGLRDAFERMGIGEYAVVGENAQRLDGQLTQKYMDMMNDKSVPEVLKAKMMAVVEGKRPSSFSPVIDSEVYRGDDGKYYLETYNKDGGVIDRKEYSSYDAARNDEKKLEYEKTLGLASVLEGEFHNEFTQEHLDGLYNKAAQKYNMGEKLTDEDKAAVYLYQNAGAIKEIMDKQQKGIILTDEEQKLVNAYRHYYDSALENSSVMREFVNTFEDSHDVAHGTLRKALESKDKKYAPLVESYLKELYNSIELKREMKQTMDDLYNTSHGNEQKRIEGESPVSPVEGSSESSAGGQEPPVSEGPAPYQDRTNSVPSPSDAEFAANPANVANSSAEVSSSESKVATSDAYVMGQNAYKNGDSEALQAINHNDDMAMARLVRAFADSEKMPDIVANAYNEGKDMELFVAQRSGSLTPAQKEAISKYVEAMDAKKGVSDAYLQEDAGYQENLVEQMKPYATEDGNIQMVELDSGKQVYLKKNGESEMVFIVAPDDQGNPVVKTISKSKIVDMGKPIPFDTFINQEVQRHEQQRNSEFLSQFGKDKLTVGEKADLAINLNDTPLKAEIVSINNDGTVSFVLGNSSRVQQVPREDFLKMRNFANTIGINAELDAEDAQRAEKEAIKAEAEKKQRFADGIVGLSEQKPDYSSKETDPKVAAEYLQEQYADNHGQLIKLVNGSRSDIKEQIDNIRKRIVEAEDWLDTNADLEPEQAQSREDKLKLAKEQLEDLTTRYDNWNKIRSLIMTEEEKRELKDERTANIKKVGIDKEALTVTDEREVPVLTDEELKKQYPAMDEASDYILSQRKEISKTQEELHRQLEDIDARLNQYLRGEADLTDEEIRDFNTTKADLEARQANLTESAKDLKAQADKLKTLYRKENMEARAKAVEDMTPAEQRAIKVENAIKNGNMNQLNSIYEDVRGATDFNDTEPNTLEEYVANNIGRFTLNYEGKEKGGAFSNGIQQETGLGRKDFEKLQILAKEGEGKTVTEFVHGLDDDMPENLKQMGYSDQDIRDAFLHLIRSAQSYSDIKNYTLNNKVTNVEQLMRDVERQEEEMKENGTHSEASFGERLKSAIAETEAEPTEAQKKAGNYKKGHLTFGGYDFTVETPKGVTRSGKDEQGKPWSVTMHDTYGYILGKIGVDGDHIDMFINDSADLDVFDGNVYVVDQVNPETGEFDEHKVMYGYPDEAAATKAYLSNYSKGWKGLGKVTSVPKATFDKWLESSDRKTKPFADYAMIKHEETKKAKESNEALPFDAPMNMDDLPFHRDVKEVKPSDMTEAQKVAYDAVSTMLKKAGIPVKVVSNEDMEKVAEAQDNLNLAMLLNQPEMRFKIKTPEEKQAAENAYNFAKELRPNKWAQYAVVDMSNPNKMPEYYQKQELARKERTYLNRLMWGNYKVFNLDKSFEDNVAGLTGSFPSEFDPYKIAAQTSKKDELKKQIKETEEAYKSTGQERKEYQNQLMKEYMDEHGLASENDIPDDVWREFDYKAIEKYQDKLDSLFAKYKDLDRQLKAIVQPGVRFLRTYHGTGASFDKFDLSHALEGEGSESFGHGVYVTNSSKIGREYAQRAKQRKMEDLYKNMRYPDGVKGDIFKRRVFGEMVNDVATGGSVASAKEFAKKRVGADVNDIQRTLENLKDREKGTEYEQNLKNRLAEYKEGLKWIDSLDEDYLTQGNANRYDVDIPDDNGSNYLDWEGTIPDSLDKQKVAEDAYKVVSDNQGFNDFKATPLNDFIAHTLKTYVNTTDVAGRVEKLKSDIKDVIENYVADDDVLALNEYLKDATPDDVLATIWYNDLVRDIKDADLGEELYRKLSTYVGDNAASQILSDNGFVGIKYPAGMIHGGAKEGDYNYVIFDENNANIVGNTKFAQGKGVVYGYTDGKEIVLNQEHLNPNTPIHEYQHLWRTAAKEMNPELIEHGDKLIMQTQLFADLKEDPNYKHLSDDEICDEAFARLTGEDGAAILEQMAKDAIKENPLDTAKELTIINRLKNWLKKFWYWTLDTFTKWKPEDIKKMTLEDIRNLVLRDLANGVDPRNVKSRMTKEDAVSLRKQMEDNAEQERILEHTEENWQKEFGKDSRVTTPIGSIKLGENQYKKAGRNDRIKRFGLLKPTLERPDVILEKSAPKEGAERQTKYLFIKSFKKADGNKILNYESITVKQGEEEVAISAHQIEPSKVVKELTESRVLWNRFRGDSNSLGENQGSALTPSANNPSGKDSVLNPHSDAKIRNNIETAKGNGGNLSVEDKIKAVSQQFGVDEADVAMYANAVKKGSTAEAARARANIKRYLLQANEDKISSFKDIIKYTKPVNEALKENFGDLDAMIEERVKQVEAQRNAMEAARKRAEEEEAKRQKHLEELSVIPDDQLDKQYMDALAKGDDATAREMLDEAARRKGYDDTESAYQGVGAWAAPGNPGYESDKARRDDWESSGSDVNLEDIALGYAPQPDDYFSHPERYSQNTPHGLESVKAINAAIDAIKNGEKDVKVKVYRAVPTSVKEGKLRNGDWVTPSKKYAEMHGTNRLEGKYRIIEDEVPANQLWWDGNDANEFGFDDGKAYKYKNAKNNRKLNDLVTYDDKGDVIPPSKRFNSRKSDIRFMFAGEKGAAEADKAEEKTYRMDNLKVAEKMERGKKDAKAIKLATGWERGADGKWRYEMPDAKIKDMKDIGGGHIVKRYEDDMLWNGGKLSNVIDAPGLFEAYPQLKDVRIDTDAIMNDMPSNGNYNAKTNTITIHADELKYMNSILNHEIQHAIQYIEGFGKGGSPEQMEKEFKAAQDEWKARAYAHELEEKAKEMGGEYNQSEVEKALVEEYKDLDMSDELPDKETRIKGFNYFARGYADRSMDDAIKRFRLNESTRFDFDSYKEYLKLAGEVESRNVEKRLGMNDEERRNSLASETEDVNRDEQIVMNGNDASYSIVKDPETIKMLDKEDTVKVYRAMQVGEDGKLYPPMAAKVKGKFVEPIELGKWEQADERPELADDKGMFTLNKGNGKSLKAAYNPYLHTSRTPLNDQFSEAQNRPNIVTVEVEVPKSELTSGYKADKAKDAVGEVEWKAGIIQGQLTGKRKVVLSRWDKPVRIVPDSEVADVIVNDMFKGKNITMPSNVVTPSLRKELEKRGVPFVETDNRGRIVGGENDGVHYSKVYGKKANVKYRFGDSYDYEKYPLGRVEPNLANKDVKIVHADANHGFKNFKEARNWAKKNIVKIYTEEETGGKGLVRISNTALDKYLSQKAVDKSDSQDVHLAVLKVLPSVLKESIDAETHPDFIKGADGERRTDNGINKDLLVHRCYGAVNIDGKIYRVKITLKEEARNKDLPHKAYSYEATKIELLAGTLVKPEGDNPNTNSSQMEPLEAIDAQAQGHGSHSNNSISVANLLKNVEMSYDKGKKLLDESEKMGILSENERKIADSVVNTANKLGGAEATVYSSLDDVPEEYRSEVEQGAKGWYDPETHSVHVYLPNCADANEAQRTVLHEKIGHEGMEVLLGGEDEVRKFANFVYNSVAASTRGKILEIANEYDPDWKKHDRMNVGTQEYIARLAEEGPKTAEDFSLWTKIKHYLIKVLKKLGIRVPGLLNDKDLRYYLMKAGRALHVWDNMPKEKQEAMMKQASNAEIKDALGEGADLPSEGDNKLKKKTERGRIDEATGAFKLVPNGEQSNLSKKQYIEARTKNFKVWFGGDWEKKPKDFKNKLDANGEPLEKYVEGYLNRPKKPTMPKKRKGEDEATFFERKILYSHALEDWPKTEADWKKRIDEFDENTLAALTPPDEEAIREKYQKQYENDMASWRKDHPYIKEGEERPLQIPDMRDYQSIQDYGEALRKHEIWKTAPHKDEYDRMAEDEIISKVALMDAVQHPFSEYARLKAMKAEFQHMRHVMQNQKVYDQNTTDAVVQFAKRFMSLGYGDDLGRGSINTLLTIVKNSTGRKSHEIPQQLYQVMDVLMNNQLRNFDRAVMKTMSIKELKENAKGIQVQGKLELRGQTTIKAFRDAVSSRIPSDKLDEKISNLIDKMTDDRKNASSYQDELLGLNLAKQYVDYIDSSRNDAIEIEDLKKLEIENYKGRKGIYKGELTKALLQEHVERLNQYDEALFNNKVERMDRYSQLLANLGGMIDESVKGAREFQERDARRAINVKMMASADLGDKSMNQHHKENWKTRLSNSDVARLFCSPLGSFDALMREFGSKQINGEGQLWNHFVRGAMKASNDEFKSVREANNEIDLKVSELFGKVTEDKNGNKKGNMILNDLYALERSNKVKSLDVTIRDIEGEQTYKLQQGNLMYIYMVNKMPDGAMKLREMGILDADVERIKENIDPRFLKLADWIQGEFLPKMRTKYNKRHEELFGAPMPMVENYFPLRVLKNARYMEEDVNNTSDGSNALPSTATGAIIKRKTNKLPLDILNSDALSVTIDNIKEMENWYNYAPIRKDANTLLSDTTFRNRVQNMTTIYGSGERLWNNVKDATAVAMGTYRPKGGTDLAVSLKNFGKGITGAKISGRLYTAFKQVLSAPLFLPDVDLGRFVRHSVHPYGSFKWAIENLPNFDKRWSGRKLGDTVLMDDPTDWKLWHTNLMEKAAYYGMTPNALVDAVTCAVGARAVYDTKYKQYIKYGLTEERAKEKALSDAEINFNTSQQSSEGAFVSPMQLDRTLESAIFTPFRNSSMLYERKGINALRNLKHRFEKGHKEASIKFMAGQLMEEGVGYEQATKAAEKMYQKGLMHNIANAIVALWLGPIIWNLGGNLGYLMFGDDNEKKKKMVLDAVILGLLEGPVDGLAGGQFINTAIANTITSDGISLKGLKNVDFSGMPMLSDFNSMIEKFGYDKVAGAQDLMFMVMQSSTGFNPKTLTDAINACIDYGNGDMTNAKEIALFVFRLMNGPAATVDNLYIDELGMKGKDAKKLSYEELAKRYAEYKFGKNTFGLGKLYSDEEKQKKLKAIEKSFDKKVSERLAGMDREDLKNEFSESRSQKEKKLIGKIIADELETKDSEAVKKAKADASYLRQRNFSDLMDDLYLQQEWESTKTAQDGLDELKGNGATDEEIKSYKLHHKPELDKRKTIEAARKAMGKEKKNLTSDNDTQVMAKIRAERDKVLIPLRKQKSEK
jgi:hypothetical protein